MSKVHDQAPSRDPLTQEWIDAHLPEQERRQVKIIKDMDALGAERDQWIEAFLERIQKRGFNVDGDMKRRVGPDEVPEKPDRPFKVVF